MTAAPKVRAASKLTLKDRLSRLTFTQACKLLGADGAKLIQRNANSWEFILREHVHLENNLFRLQFPESVGESQPVVVSIMLSAESLGHIQFKCSQCQATCAHVGAAFSLILEEKMALGLAAPPPPREPVESLNEEELVRQALDDRAERARTEKMTIKTQDPERPWTDYVVTSRLSGKSYRVALRGLQPGDSFCSCADFRANTLGTCKHILKVIAKVKRQFSPRQLGRRYRPNSLMLHLQYGQEVTLRLLAPDIVPPEIEKIIGPLRERSIQNLHDLMNRLARLQRIKRDVTIYPDAEEFIQQRMTQARLAAAGEEIRRDPASHPLRTTLLKIPLLPYQLDGIAFAAGAGRAILADDMGLGKTIQGVGTAEFLAKECQIEKVLVVCPTSVKPQWQSEIRRFCDRDVQLVNGATAERRLQYSNPCFFTICNYEQVLRDLPTIESVKWDLIILDEGQRIKNWESKTSKTIKALKSRFALVLSGTPLENRLDDLYSILQFVDDRRLGPGFRFFNKYRVVDEKGKVLGYKNLGDLRDAIKPVMLRRTRDSVRLELPERTTEFLRIAPTGEQYDMHQSHMRIVSSIVRKKFISEMDLLRLRKELLMCRMSADSTFLVDKKKPGFSTKLERLDELFETLFEEDDRKVVLFSEWTTMLDLIEPLLKKRKLGYVRLDGSVPQRKRQELVHSFQTDSDCRLFLSTNAGSTGLNLQAANTIVNVDLPWNPAILEQRIARAHRMGQQRAVQVYVMVTEETIEESLLRTLAAKRDLALAALDSESDVDEVDVASGLQELKNRLEVLLGSVPESPAGASSLQQTTVPATTQESHRERVAAASGELLGAAFKLLGELVEQVPGQSPPTQLVDGLRAGLAECVTGDAQGRQQLTISFPDRSTIDQFAQTLARLLVSGNSLPAAPAAAEASPWVNRLTVGARE